MKLARLAEEVGLDRLGISDVIFTQTPMKYKHCALLSPSA